MNNYSLSDRANAFFEKHWFAAGILTVAAMAGVLTVAIVAPNAVQIFSPRRGIFPLKNRNWRKTLRHMEQHKYLKLKQQKNNTITYAITDHGIHKLFTIKPPPAPQPHRWDGKWRLVIFDIKEKHRHTRDTLRMQLRSLGFQPLQRSVWISPYPMHKEFLKILRVATATRSIELHYLHVYRFDNDITLLRHFPKINDR